MKQDPHHLPDVTLDDSSAETVHVLMRFLQTAWRRKIYVITSLLVAGLFGAIYFFTTERIYEASAQLLILQSGPEVWNPNASADVGKQAMMPTYERLFSSTIVLDGAINELEKMPAEARIDLANAPRDRWVNCLRSNLSAQAIRRTNVIEIRYKSHAPKAAESVVHAIVNSYLSFIESNHKNVSAEVVQILETDRRNIEKQVLEKQQRLVAAQRSVRALGIEENVHVVHPTVQRVIRLNESLLTVQQDRLALEANLATIRQAIREGADLRQHLAVVEPIIGREMMMNTMGLNVEDIQARADVERSRMENQSKLATLMQHYGRRHPRVTETMDAIQSADQYLRDYDAAIGQRMDAANNQNLGPMLLAMVEEKLANLWAHESKLAKQYEQAEGEAVLLNDRLSEMSIVRHDLDRLKNLHDTLLDRIANIDITQNHADVRVSVVSEPHSTGMPVSPRISLLGIFCLFGGLSVGLSLVYVVDVMDDRFRSPEELQQQIGAPVLAMIRELTPAAETGVDAIQVHFAPGSVESEAFRTLRTTLAFSGREMERLAVTSSEPGDGKTTVIANLATSFAQAGKRTLLIDADMRRPGLSKLFEMRGQGGLSEILRSEQQVSTVCEDCTQASGIKGLDVIPCGPKPSNPAELLSSSRMVDLLGWADGHYDQVLIDCPPILAASDAAVVGRLCDGLMLVVQPEKNHRRLVLRAVAGLSSIGVQLIGTIVNKIGGENGNGYYGYGGYGYGYGNGYDEPDEFDTPEMAASESPATIPIRQDREIDAQKINPRRAA